MESTTRSRLEEFATYWEGDGKGREKQDAGKFWTSLFKIMFGWGELELSSRVQFEYPVNGGYIDVLCPDARFLVEQKSRDVDLDKPEPRRGVMVTPVQQALQYANDLPASHKPRYLCTCDFGRFRFYDLDEDPTAKVPFVEFPLGELPDRADVLRQIFSRDNSRIHIQEQVSREAGVLVARLHNELAAQYADPDAPESHHALSILTVRLVFLMYAEDAGLFPTPGMFADYVASYDTDRLRRALMDLLDVLDTPETERDPYLEPELAAFPYVDGGLFAGQVETPRFTDGIRDALLAASRGFDWAKVSPVVFGSLMEETLSHDQRRQGGMHYTTVRNIHRVIDPLFLNDLTAELDGLIRDSNMRMAEEAALHGVKGGQYVRYRKRGRTLDATSALHKFREKLGNLSVADFSCGSGNFITESYLRLRELENRALTAELGGQGALMADDDLVKVHIDQFHGMEINDFACAVARTALWIAEQQSLDDTEAIAGRTLDRLPLHDSGNIMCANALTTDWNQLLPGDRCDYVVGNPPFVGHISKSANQTAELKTVWGEDYDGYLDYATAWHRKASRYLTKPDAAFALVSTNSITQGQPVGSLFRPLAKDGWRIRFAHRTFAWDAQSSDMAHVHVVIIGMDRQTDKDKPPVLYSYDDIDGDPTEIHPTHLNGYLLDAPDMYAVKRNQKIGPLSSMLNRVDFGSMPLDGGNLLLNNQSEHNEAMADPIAAKYVRPFRGSRELIDGTDRWCLWLQDAQPSDLKRSPFLRKRVDACAEYRRNAPTRGDAYKHRETPWLFRDDHQPHGRYLAIPRVFSVRRLWATCDLLQTDIVASDACFTCEDMEGFNFAVIESSMFMAWQKAIGGRLKSDCRFSATVVWNTLPLPQLDETQRAKVISSGQKVLDARANHPGQSLADLYDPDYMPVDLRKAHRQLDRVVDVAFGADQPCKTDEERLEVLFRQYAAMTAGR